MVRLKVGVIGCGLIAQVMHLNYLRELSEHFEIAALCDISEKARTACAREYSVSRTTADWKDLLQENLDAVFILTPGSHAPIAIAAAHAGLHVFAEKPMCFSVAEGQEMISAAQQAKTVLMVGYNKRFDPAFQKLQTESRSLKDLRLVRVTTLESPLGPYVSHFVMHRGEPVAPSFISAALNDNETSITGAIGKAPALIRKVYHLVLLDSMVHEFNALRGILGEPDELLFASIRETGLTVILRFGAAECVVTWVDLPSIARYSFALYCPDRRLTLSFPSPFLRNMPTLFIDETGEPSSVQSRRNEEIVSYAESFKEELLHFHHCVTNGLEPITSGAASLGDIALCQSVVRSSLTGKSVALPTRIG